MLGFWIFHGLFGIGDTNKFDWGSLVGAVIGAMIIVVIASFLVKRSARRHAAEAPARGLRAGRATLMVTQAAARSAPGPSSDDLLTGCGFTAFNRLL